MQIVIDILDDTYGYFTPKKPREMTNKDAANWFVVLHKAIFVNGKVLPKGHGRLIDADAVLSKIESEYERAEVAMWLYSVAAIVEADKDKEVDE